jgi:YHS domain-containing protein
MIRAVFYLLLVAIGLTLIRTVLGVLAKTLFGGAAPAGQSAARRPEQVPAAGVLRKDPVCGVYVSEAVSLKLKQGGETVHFCSQKCRDAFKA